MYENRMMGLEFRIYVIVSTNGISSANKDKLSFYSELNTGERLKYSGIRISALYTRTSTAILISRGRNE